jgi:deoxyhypusine synthase
MHHDSTVIEEIYDNIFKNTQFSLMDFCEEFPASWIDNDNATIYLAKNEGVELFKIKIERV